MTITSRPYRDAHDLEAMKAFLTRATALAPQYAYAHVGDLIWGMYQNIVFDPHANVQLWEQDDVLVGFAWADPPMVVVTQVDPALRWRAGLEPQMLAWAEQHVRDQPRSAAALPTLWMLALQQDPDYVSFLLEQGYTRDDDSTHTLRRDLGVPIPDTRLPAGFTVRHVAGENEWAERVETHREVWHPSRVTLEAYRRLRAAPGYIPELDLVAVAPDGKFAAYCICWLDPVNRTGEFEPVGTRPAYRGQGLGKAVMLEGLRRLRARGAEAALVYSLSNNQASLKLYQSVGFTIVDEQLFFWKHVE